MPNARTELTYSYARLDPIAMRFVCSIFVQHPSELYLLLRYRDNPLLDAVRDPIPKREICDTETYAASLALPKARKFENIAHAVLMLHKETGIRWKKAAASLTSNVSAAAEELALRI